MNKCIIFARVSTEQQSLDEQSKQLQDMAIKDGYSKSNQYIIEIKESAIKLSEEKRLGLNKMKELIENDSNINCIYIWEISRWARWKHILFNLEHYLVEKQIQLKVKTPEIILLNQDGSLNNNADWMFTIYAQLAETEMNLKQERFKRAKNERLRAGYKVNPLPFGYTTDEDRRVIIDKEQAKVVKQVFAMTGHYSKSQIVKHFTALGWHLTQKHILFITNHRAYINDYTDKNGLHIEYPRLITDEEWQRVQEINKVNRGACKTRVWLLTSGLLHCPICGASMKRIANSYQCARTDKSWLAAHQHMPELLCDFTKSINVNLMDKISLYVAKGCLFIHNKQSTKEQKKNIKHEITESEKRKKVLQSKIDGIILRKERISISFENGAISIDKFKERIEAVNEEEKEMKNEQQYINGRIDELNREYENLFDTNKSLREMQFDYNTINNTQYLKEDAYKLTHKFITEVKFRYLDSTRKIIQVCTTNNGNIPFMITGRGNNQRIHTTTEIESLNKDLNELSIDDFNEIVRL